jgi:predicted Rossmann-fold nucleotide-binding protein
MLQHSEIKQRFGLIEREIGEAATACQADAKLPQKLKDCVIQWELHTNKAKQIMSSQDDKSILRCVDDLEEIGQRAEEALRGATGINNKVKTAVVHAHSELADLKRQLH